MGKKGKGRQSGGFGSKSLKANHHEEVRKLRDETLKWTRRETAGFVAWSNAHQRQQRRLAGERPKFALALRRNLNGILHERQALRSHQLRERRRRNGFLPRDDRDMVSSFVEDNVSNGLSHPSGWLIRHGNSSNGDVFDQIADETEMEDMDTFGVHKRRSVPMLQTLALKVFAHYIRDYRSAMGDEELYGALSILPPESITDLSILLSSETAASNTSPVRKRSSERGGDRRRRRDHDTDLDSPPVLYMDDDLAMLLGQHQHVEHLCFRSRLTTSTGRGTLTNVGLEALIPRNPVLPQGRHRRRRKDDSQYCDRKSKTEEDESSTANEDIPESWEDGDDSSNSDDMFDFEQVDIDVCNNSPMISGSSGCNLRLRRLELLDLTCADNSIDVHVDDNGNASTTSILLRWFEKCLGITHLSLAGSFRVHHEVGRAILLSLPSILPFIEVLDVTRCPWATDSLLARMMNGYFQNQLQVSSRKVHKAKDDEDENETDNRSCSASFPNDLLPTVYYYRGRFEWIPETMHNVIDTDLWDDKSVG
eukprot:CAMPEP_0116152260 /NCGR_PEP_ID=MMETSP0329-20121206/20552_1 /TAXON_ID=697910 /ORGANISM="Pseudo-nitzschia arenysensis, Strain B593" /LENGTH=535 /DNA_ID=CAMNT_0003648961 /DNA_START=110 /DNA_END=1717 /DNA_ORIENTATION=-